MDRLDEMLAQSDILVVVVPLTELTRGMIGADELDLLPHGRIRGEHRARRHRRRGAPCSSGSATAGSAASALDVFDDEPLAADSPWWSEPARWSRRTWRGSPRNTMHRPSTSWSRT